MSEQKRLLKQRETTESKVMRLKRTVPEITGNQIGETLGISGEWARRLLLRNDPDYISRQNKIQCPVCEKPLEKTKNQENMQGVLLQESQFSDSVCWVRRMD